MENGRVELASSCRK